MRPDQAGQISAYLAANRNFYIADLYTFKTTYGEVFQYSGYTVPIFVSSGFFSQDSVNFGQNVQFRLGPKFGRSKVTTKIGVQIETMDLDVYASADDLIGTLTWQAAFFNGVFDLATVELGRAVLQVNPSGGLGPLVGYVIWFQGLVGDVEFGRTALAIKVNSTTVLLSTQYPRRLWQATCSHVFGDAMCQFDRYSMAVTVTAQSASTGQIVTGFNPSPSNLYDDGTIIGLSGANGGLKRTVSGAESGTVYLTVPYVYPVNSGDMFQMLPGCDHTLSACQNYFNNLGHYGGQPYIPPAEFGI
jgi:uncharacterized phage protein (TIGR02218 family)